MKPILTYLSFLLLLTATLPIYAGDTSNKRAVTVKKYPRINNSKTGIRVPSAIIMCTIGMEEGIQPIDTSDIVSYEVWDSCDTAPMIICENENHFIDYVLDFNSEGIIKLFTTDYVYIGFIESTNPV